MYLQYYMNHVIKAQWPASFSSSQHRWTLHFVSVCLSYSLFTFSVTSLTDPPFYCVPRSSTILLYNFFLLFFGLKKIILLCFGCFCRTSALVLSGPPYKPEYEFEMFHAFKTLGKEHVQQYWRYGRSKLHRTKSRSSTLSLAPCGKGLNQ